MARRIEQGSVLGFVLVGAILVGLLVGGVYVVRHIQSVGNSTTAKPAVPSKDNQTTDSGSSAPAKPSTSGDDQLKAALNAQSSKNDTQSSSSSADNTSSSASALPKTGPEQVVVPMLGAALLVASAVSYTRSRRLI